VPQDAYLRRIIDMGLEPVTVPREGIVLGERLAEILGARPGDEITVEVREGARRTRQVPVVGVAAQYVGAAAYMDLSALNRLTGTGEAISSALLMTDARHEESLTRSLRERPRVAGIMSQERVIESFQESYERSMLTFTFILSLFAGVIAFGVVYNSARISLSERDRELASLRVLGLTRGEISYILLGELAFLTLLAIPVGFAMGALLGSVVVESVETDLYQFPLVLGRRTFGLAAAVVLTAGSASAILIRRQLDRLDLVGVLKTRE
jgi:putative ABC transport system permease protein